MNDPVIDRDELDDVEDRHREALSLRRPDVPVTLTELASMKGAAIEVVEARAQVLQTLRTQSIKATHPTDWLLFKAPADAGGQIVGYLDDAGCDRVRDLWGITVTPTSKPEKVAGDQPGIFYYFLLGDGHCKITQQSVSQMEGGRASTDDFAKGTTGAALELLIRKAARANLDGGITRELAGMKSVPIEELARAWQGTSKKVSDCRHGRGFGSRDERLGATAAGVPDVPPPVCPHCGATGVYRPAKDNRGAFYGCPHYAKHANKKWIVDAAKWVAEQQKPTPAKPKLRVEPTGVAGCLVCNKPLADHKDADHDYDAPLREPGEEG